MTSKLITALSVLIVAVLAACNNAKSPDAVANDVAAAQQKVAENAADVRKDASKDNVSATDKVDDKKEAFEGESRVARSDAKAATHQHGSVTFSFLTT
jgi:hypothetical protein